MDVRVASWLNSQGHDAIHLRDEGLQRLPNGGIFEKAITESRVVVTFDLDFGEIVALAKGRKTGVILFRLRNTRTSFVIERLADVISECADALTRGAIVIVEKPRHRIREYWVDVPSLPGCFSQGETIDEAMNNAREAIELHIQGLKDEGQQVPKEEGLVIGRVDIKSA